jgi:hypothetical protein
MTAQPLLFRTCRCWPLDPRGCVSCREFLRRKRELEAEAGLQQRPAAGDGLSLRELRAENQARIRRERYGDET